MSQIAEMDDLQAPQKFLTAPLSTKVSIKVFGISNLMITLNISKENVFYEPRARELKINVSETCGCKTNPFWRLDQLIKLEGSINTRVTETLLVILPDSNHVSSFQHEMPDSTEEIPTEYRRQRLFPRNFLGIFKIPNGSLTGIIYPRIFAMKESVQFDLRHHVSLLVRPVQHRRTSKRVIRGITA
ncbi:hypothetical protein YC2023_079821 [Brassica napus]